MKKIKEKKFVFVCSGCGVHFEVKTKLGLNPEEADMIHCEECSKIFNETMRELKIREAKARKDSFFYCEECGAKVNEIIDDNCLYCPDCTNRLLDQLEHEENEGESLR